MSNTHKELNKQEAIIEWVENLSSEDPKRKIKAIGEIKDIAGYIGFARTRNELLKYFYELYDDNDEVISELIDQLEDFMYYIEGPAYTAKLMPHFEKICYVDCKYARDKWYVFHW